MYPTTLWLQPVRQKQICQLPQQRQHQHLQQQQQACPVPMTGLSSREAATSCMGGKVGVGHLLMPLALLMGPDLHLFILKRKILFLIILPMDVITGLEAIRRLVHGSGLTLQALTLMTTVILLLVDVFIKVILTMGRAGQVLLAVIIMSFTLFVSKWFYNN